MKRKSTPEKDIRKLKENAKEPEEKILLNLWDSNSTVPWSSENKKPLTSRLLLLKIDLFILNEILIFES